jgi:hypothetical protein
MSPYTTDTSVSGQIRMVAELETALELRMVFRKTNAGAGGNISVTPANSTNRHLSYGRIILNDKLNKVSKLSTLDFLAFRETRRLITTLADGACLPKPDRWSRSELLKLQHG